MDWKSYLENTETVIHAGGLSERWFPITQGKIPKPLTEIGIPKRPIIDWTILPYVKAGVKKFFITVWHGADKIIEYCNKLSKISGVRFVFLKEESKRMGRAGVVKFYLENGILHVNKPKLMIGAADILNIDLEKFIQFHFSGLPQGYSATLVGSRSGQSQFDRIIFDSQTRQISRMEVERAIALPEGVNANTGTSYFDSKLNHVFLSIRDDMLPVDWENLDVLLSRARCFGEFELFKSWIPLKTPYDYNKAKDLDFEKWFDIDSVEKYLGNYESKNSFNKQ